MREKHTHITILADMERDLNNRGGEGREGPPIQIINPTLQHRNRGREGGRDV